jgi:nitroreductase
MTGPEMLDWLRTRRSRRSFTGEPIGREALDRLFHAAVTAPSSSNRQPWRFAVVTAPERRARIVDAVRRRTEEMKAIIQRGHHAQDFADYGDFFFEPLESAAAIVIPQYREVTDLIAQLIASGGGDPSRYHTAASMQAELCSTSAAVMALLLQAHAEGLGACWMAGPMVARDEIGEIVGIAEPWRMVGAIALGHPVDDGGAKPQRKPIEKVVTWFDKEEDR